MDLLLRAGARSRSLVRALGVELRRRLRAPARVIATGHNALIVARVGEDVEGEGALVLGCRQEGVRAARRDDAHEAAEEEDERRGCVRVSVG